MSKGIKFHGGSKKLKLSKEVVNNALEESEGFEINTEKEGKRFFQLFMDDVTKFQAKVEENTKTYYDESTELIAEFLKIPECSTAETRGSMSVFSPLESFGTLRTALVQCNFTDITRLLKDLRRKLKEQDENEEEEDERSTDEVVITECDAIHAIIDRISASEADRCILFVQQFESLRPQTLDSIISLMYSNDSIRSKISNIRMVVCVSTSPAFFTTSCTMDSLNLLEIKKFQFTRLDDIFDKVISTDISPAIFSGQFLKYLRTRFFACDYSVSALIKAVQFAYLQKYIDDPLWRMDSEGNKDGIGKYFAILEIFSFEVMHNENETETMKLHIDVQTNAEFWKCTEESDTFRQWKQFIFETKSKEQMLRFLEKLRNQLESSDPEWCSQLKKLVKKMNMAIESQNMEPKEVSTPTKTPAKTPAKMNFTELRRQQEAKRKEFLKNPAKEASAEICGFVMDLFKTVLQPYPTEWRNVIGKETISNENLKISLDSNDEFDIEKCLLGDENCAHEPISVAWRTLLCHKSFKTVPMSEWAADFVRNYKADKENQKEAFFGAAGQLEHMGLIRGGADKKSTIHVLYHPISHIANI